MDSACYRPQEPLSRRRTGHSLRRHSLCRHWLCDRASRHSRGYAFKWQDESAETALDHIEWSCATSTISPVAVFNPVELEGTTVRRASLCNISECERLGIGGKGTRLSVIKANKIIPKVIKVLEPVGTFSYPHQCPVCGFDTKVETSETSGTKTLHCTNPSCPAKQLKSSPASSVSRASTWTDCRSRHYRSSSISDGYRNTPISSGFLTTVRRCAISTASATRVPPT